MFRVGDFVFDKPKVVAFEKDADSNVTIYFEGGHKKTVKDNEAETIWKLLGGNQPDYLKDK